MEKIFMTSKTPSFKKAVNTQKLLILDLQHCKYHSSGLYFLQTLETSSIYAFIKTPSTTIFSYMRETVPSR